MTITNNNEWIEWNWTPEKPYPETLETRVFVKFSDGTDDCENNTPMEVSWWAGGEYLVASSWEQCDDGCSIVSYRLA